MIIDMLVQASSDLETHFVSVERVKEYSAVTPEVFMHRVSRYGQADAAHT